MNIQQLFEVWFLSCGLCFSFYPGNLFLAQISNSFINPVCLKPVIWSIRIAVKPVFRPAHRTTARCLIDKALWHQRHLIAEQPRQSNTLYQVLAALVLTAKNVKIVGDCSAAYFHQIICPVVYNLIPAALKHQLEPKQHVAPEGSDGLAAHGEVLAVKGAHGPHHKRQ